MHSLGEPIRQLSRQIGRLNLYIRVCCDNSEPDTFRLEEELKSIKKLIINIEKDIERLKYK